MNAAVLEFDMFFGRLKVFLSNYLGCRFGCQFGCHLNKKRRSLLVTSLHLVYATIPAAHFKQDLPANNIITELFGKVKKDSENN